MSEVSMSESETGASPKCHHAIDEAMLPIRYKNDGKQKWQSVTATIDISTNLSSRFARMRAYREWSGG